MPTSVKIKFRPSTVAQKDGSLYYQVIHCQLVRQISTTYRIFSQEWDDKEQYVVLPGGNKDRVVQLNSIRKHIAWDMSRIRRVINKLRLTGDRFTADDIVREYQRLSSQSSLCCVMRDIISSKRLLGHVRTAETYETALNSFLRFMGGEDVPLDGLDAFLMQQYEAWLKGTGVTPNTSSFYLKRLRAAYNVAVDRGLIAQNNPFCHVYTGKEKTVKRAVTPSVIKRVKALDLHDNPRLAFSRDMFLFSFYTRGMSFIDMAYLKKSDLRDGYLSYRRQKTGQQLRIKWERCMQQIVDAHVCSKGSLFLLPIITETGNEREQYKRMQFQINYDLKRISELADISPALTMYVARHSWASIAKAKNISESTISDGLGHDSEKTTRIYLAELNTSLVDRANRKILSDF